MRTETPPVIHLKDYRPCPYHIDEVALDFVLGPKSTKVSSVMKMRPNPAAGDNQGKLKLDGEMIKLKSIKLDGKALNEGDDYELGDESLTIFNLPNKPFELSDDTVCNPDRIGRQPASPDELEPRPRFRQQLLGYAVDDLRR